MPYKAPVCPVQPRTDSGTDKYAPSTVVYVSDPLVPNDEPVRIPWLAFVIIGALLAALIALMTFNSDDGDRPRGPATTPSAGTPGTVGGVGQLPPTLDAAFDCESSDGPQFACWLALQGPVSGADAVSDESSLGLVATL